MHAGRLPAVLPLHQQHGAVAHGGGGEGGGGLRQQRAACQEGACNLGAWERERGWREARVGVRDATGSTMPALRRLLCQPLPHIQPARSLVHCPSCMHSVSTPPTRLRTSL